MPHLTFRTAPLALALACSATPDSDSSATDAPGTSTAAATTADPPTSASTSAAASGDASTSESPTTSGPTSEPGTTTTGPETTTAPDTSDTTGAPLGCAELPLCDDFESAAVDGPPDPALWTVSSPNCSGTGTLQVSGEQAHGGARSLKVTGGGGYCDHVFIAHTAAIAGLGPQVFGRFHVRLDAALGDGHVTFVTLRDSADGGGKDLRMGGQSEILMWNRESDDATLPSLSPAGIAASLAIAPQQWTCVEFMIDQDAALLTTWVDGAEVQGLVVDAAPTPDLDQQWHNKADWKPVLEDIKFGWESYAGQAMNLYFDDIALADARVGCG